MSCDDDLQQLEHMAICDHSHCVTVKWSSVISEADRAGLQCELTGDLFKSSHFIEQDKVNTADSAFIFLIIQSQNQWSGWRRWSGLVFARKIARMILIQNV